MPNTKKILNQIAQIIYDKKGVNILAIDVRGLSSITDFLLIAEGIVDRHVISIAQAILEEMKGRKGLHPLRSEGLQNGDWVVLDFGAIMVHLFKPGLREKYSLDRLWSEGTIVDLGVELEKPAVGEAKRK